MYTSEQKLEQQIFRLENQIQALVACNKQLMESLLVVGKMTGSLSGAEQEALRGQLIALRSLRPKK